MAQVPVVTATVAAPVQEPRRQPPFHDCCNPCQSKLQIPVPPSNLASGLAQQRWDAVNLFDCCSYKPPAEAEMGCCGKDCTWCPTFFQAVMSPCCVFGQIVTLHHKEDTKCLGMGAKGAGACCCLCIPVWLFGIPPGSPIQFHCIASMLTVVQEHMIFTTYNLAVNELQDNFATICCCYCCALWKQWVFLHEMQFYSQKGFAAETTQQVGSPAPGDAIAVQPAYVAPIDAPTPPPPPLPEVPDPKTEDEALPAQPRLSWAQPQPPPPPLPIMPEPKSEDEENAEGQI